MLSEFFSESIFLLRDVEMEEIKFTYMLTPYSNCGYIEVFKGDQSDMQDENNKDVLVLCSEEDLLEAFKVYTKGSIFIIDDDPELVAEAKRLAEKLNLPLQCP